ncbi:hypothetical protein CN984_20685 [Bacillus cereus]|uniref:Uncharacterized protein n=1 Tax=Bacillus cereus TaxID=1396 RepID=A0A2B9PNH9_BACCE|nr:hypothetical protein CN984_20685 [Bacillus cereus]
MHPTTKNTYFKNFIKLLLSLFYPMEGILHRVKVTCLNEECEFHKNPERGMLFAVDTMGFAYYVESDSERIQEI